MQPSRCLRLTGAGGRDPKKNCAIKCHLETVFQPVASVSYGIAVSLRILKCLEIALLTFLKLNADNCKYNYINIFRIGIQLLVPILE